MIKCILIVAVFLTLTNEAHSACSGSDSPVSIGVTIFSGTTVAGVNYYYYNVPYNSVYFVSLTLQETGTPTNSISIIYRINTCPTMTNSTYISGTDVAFNGYNTMAFGVSNVYLGNVLYFGVSSLTAGIAYKFEIDIDRSATSFSIPMNAQQNVFGTYYLTFSPLISGPWKASFKHYGFNYTAELTRSAYSTTKVITSANSYSFDSCSSFANGARIKVIGTESTTPKVSFICIPIAETTITSISDGISLTGQTLAPGASVIYSFPQTAADIPLYAYINESGAVKNNLKLYWNSESCPNTTNNFHTHGTSNEGRYYSFLYGYPGTYSFSLVNHGASTATYSLSAYVNVSFPVIPTGYNVNGYLIPYKSITFVTTGTATQLALAASGNFMYLYAAYSYHPSQYYYDYMKYVESNTTNSTIMADSCGQGTVDRIETAVTSAYLSTSFVFSATNVAFPGIVPTILTSGEAVSGTATTFPGSIVYSINTVANYSLRVTLSGNSDLRVNVYSVCPSTNPVPQYTLKTVTDAFITSTPGRTFFTIYSVNQTVPYTFKVELFDNFVTNSPVSLTGYSTNIGDQFYFIFNTSSGFWLRGANVDNYAIYVKKGSRPTTSSYNYQGRGGVGTGPCYINGTSEWHIMLRSTSSYDNAWNLTIQESGTSILQENVPQTFSVDRNFYKKIFYFNNVTRDNILLFNVSSINSPAFSFRVYSICPEDDQYDVSISLSSTNPGLIPIAVPNSMFYVYILTYNLADIYTMSYQTVSVMPLTQGIQKVIYMTGVGSWAFFSYEATGPFNATFSGIYKNVYFRYGALPTNTTYDFASPYNISKISQTVSTPCAVATGTWYIGVYLYTAYSYDTTFKISITSLNCTENNSTTATLSPVSTISATSSSTSSLTSSLTSSTTSSTTSSLTSSVATSSTTSSLTSSSATSSLASSVASSTTSSLTSSGTTSSASTGSTASSLESTSPTSTVESTSTSGAGPTSSSSSVDSSSSISSALSSTLSVTSSATSSTTSSLTSSTTSVSSTSISTSSGGSTASSTSSSASMSSGTLATSSTGLIPPIIRLPLSSPSAVQDVPISGSSLDVNIPFAVENGTAEIMEADSSNPRYVDPSASSNKQFRGSSFFITIYNANGTELHTNFSEPIQIELEGNFVSGDELYYYDTELQQWIAVLGTCPIDKQNFTVVNGAISVSVCHLTQFAVFASNNGAALKESSPSALLSTRLIIIIACAGGVGLIAIIVAAVFITKKVKKSRYGGLI